MDRRSFLTRSARGLLVSSSTLAFSRRKPAPYDLNLAAADGETFYVAADGDDAKAGRRPETAWQSIDRLNEALSDGTVGYGQTVLFRRGDEFFGEISRIPESTQPTGAPLVIAAYGQGSAPKISAYKVIGDARAWEMTENDIWRVNLVDRSSYSGNLANPSANTGFIRVDGRIFGVKRWNSDDLADQWDFYNDATYLYVKSSGNPADQANDVRVAVDGNLINGFSWLSVSGLDLVGTGGHGFRVRGGEHIQFTDCRVHEIGGAQFESTTRYGNGVELWMGSADTWIGGNEIFDVYDAACTLQGAQAGASQAITRCKFSSNKIWGCTQTFEYWGQGDNEAPGAGFVECSFTENVCVSAGRSWGYSVRPDQLGKGNFLMAYGQDVPVDIAVTRNLFFDALDCYQFVSSNDYRLRDGYRCDQNVIALRAGTLIQAQLPFTIDQSADWIAITGQDRDSRWLTVPQSVVTSEDAMRYVTTNLSQLQPA